MNGTTDATDARISVMLVVSSLEHGGAQRQVVQLANHLDPRRFAVGVCSLSDCNPLAKGLIHPNKLSVVKKNWRFDYGAVTRLARLFRAHRVDVAHAFLFDADIATRLAGRRAGTPVVIASERNADYHRPLLHTVCYRLTNRWFDAMIANSHAGKAFNIRTLGIGESRIHVVPNGVDIERFSPSPDASLRTELGIAGDVPVVGMVASFKPQKNHHMFARLAMRLLDRNPDVHFILAGGLLQADGPVVHPGGTATAPDAGGAMVTVAGEPTGAMRANARMHKASHAYFADLQSVFAPLEARQRLWLLGNRNDMHRVYNTCDVTVLTSHHEGTSNVLLESMACGVPVVATAVCDNPRIVADGEVGFVVPPDDDCAMSERVGTLLADRAERTRMSNAARQWVQRRYSNQALADRTAECYVRVLDEKRATTRAGHARA